MKDLKLIGLKSHDCHVLMQQLLPVAIRSVLPKHVRYAITNLCLFFSEICKKVLDIDKLDKLQSELVVTLCQLEMIFPPSFIDIMIHLVIHLVRQVKMLGPVHLHWMYPFERNMSIFKGDVRNRSSPEGSIIEGYVARETMDFCVDVLGHEKCNIQKSRHEENFDGKGTIGRRSITISCSLWEQEHLYVIYNTEAATMYVTEHGWMIKR